MTFPFFGLFQQTGCGRDCKVQPATQGEERQQGGAFQCRGAQERGRQLQP